MINTELTIDTVIAFVTEGIYFDSCTLSGQKEGVSIVRTDKDSNNYRKNMAEALILCSMHPEIANNNEGL